jgi:hypothetical protein
MKDILCNDKFLVTVAVTILGVGGYIWSVIVGPSPENIITAIVSGLFGMAAGRAMQRTDDGGRENEKPKK